MARRVDLRIDPNLGENPKTRGPSYARFMAKKAT
jgi:hypothetical protein